jgi:perosamine synthetase
MTNIQAAIGLGQMSKLNRLIEKKREIAGYYNKRLNQTPGIILPIEESWGKSVFWLYSLLLKPEAQKTRDDLIVHLSRAGVESRPVFYPISSMPPYQGQGNYPISEGISRGGISLPSGGNLTRSEQDQVISLIQEFLKG